MQCAPMSSCNATALTKKWGQKLLDKLPEGDTTRFLEFFKEHPTNAGVVEHACRALSILTINTNNKVAIAKERGITRILEAFKKHPTHAGVVKWACRALFCLAANNAANKATIAKEGGITRLLEALQQHPTHANVQENACLALDELADNAANTVAMAKVGIKQLP